MALDFADVTLYNNPPGLSGGTSIYSFGAQGFDSQSDGMWIKDVDPGAEIVNAVIGIQTNGVFIP